MRRSLILSTVLATSVAVLGACENKPETPNKPVATPVPIATASPQPSPAASPLASPVTPPVKPGSTPDVKKVNDKDAKPTTTQIPKVK